MKSVELLLRDDVVHLGKVGDVVRVAPGYARNFLVPMGLAVQATPENVQVMARKRAQRDAEEAARVAELSAFAEALSGVRVETAERADETGSLYGSVPAARVAELLSAAGHAIEERQVRLAHPLKTVGEHAVPIHVHGELEAEVTVVVTAAEA